MFGSPKKSLGWRSSYSIIGMGLFMFYTPAQAGLFDAITDGIGNLGGKSSTSEPATSSNRPPPDPASFKPVEPTVKAENLEALPKTKKIILANFVVEFQKRYEKTKKGFSLLGMGNAGSSTAINDVTLPDQNTLQIITNFAYLDVLKKLKEKGYEVIEVSALSDKAKPSYEKMTKSAFFKPGDKFDNIDGDSVLYSPDGMTSVHPFMGCAHYLPEQSKFGAKLASFGRNYEVAGNAQMENDIALAEGDIPVLKVWYTIGFGDVEAKGGNAFVSARQNDYLGTTKTTVANSANTNATAGMFLKPEVSRFSILLPSHDSMRAGYKQSCAVQFGFVNSDHKTTSPADGDVLILLADKYHDDGDKVLSMSSQAGTVEVTDRAIGGGIGLRSVKENNDGTQAQSSDNGNGVQLTRKDSTRGTVDIDGMNTHLHTTSEYATSIRSDVYATSAATMIYKVSGAFVSKLP